MAIKCPEIQYREADDGMFDPVLSFPEQPEGNVGKYGGMRRDYLKEHHKAAYARMCLEGTLKRHLMDMNAEAKEMVNRLMDQLQSTGEMPDKNTDPLGWIRHMNGLKLQAEEIMKNELLY